LFQTYDAARKMNAVVVLSPYAKMHEGLAVAWVIASNVITKLHVFYH